jgi:50S ribosomal protein L16 3-hydroxylase
VPHWGIAQDRCMTYSIGMRAPQFSEFIAVFDRLFPGCRRTLASQQDMTAFYQDPDLSPDEAVPGLISERALQRAEACFRFAECSGPNELAMTFGCLVTDPKAWLTPERMSVKAARKALADSRQKDAFSLHGMARVAFTQGSVGGSATRVFANGLQCETGPALAGPVAELCLRRELPFEVIDHWRSDPELRELLEWLLGCGVFDLGDE